MARLTDTARDRLSVARNQAQIPEWFWKVGVVAAIVFALVGAWQFVAETRAGRNADDTAEDVVVPSSDPLPDSAYLPDSGGTVTLTDETGAAVEVSRAGAQLAVAVAIAKITGDWSGIPPIPGFAPMPVAEPPVAPQVVSQVVTTGSRVSAVTGYRVRIAAQGGATIDNSVFILADRRGVTWVP